MQRKITIKNLIFITIITLFISGVFGFFGSFVFASSTDGTVDLTYKYAWTENTGWLNFGTTEGNVHITDSALKGYVWAENIGWISLNCSNDNSCGSVDYKVSNNGEGNLSGYAWSENTGWINFNPTYGGVTINSSGEFLGYAWGENIGWIIFDCSTSACVKTDWRPQSARPASSPVATPPVVTPYPGGSRVSPPEEKSTIVEKIQEEFKEISEKAKELVKKIPKIPEKIAEIFRPKPPEEIKPPEVPFEELVPKEAPLAFQAKWQLLPSESIREFVLSPLSKEIRKLAEKFPELEKTFEKVGITKITDIEKLKAVQLTLPGLKELEEMPTEIVFAKTGGELIDLNIALTVSEKGELQQKITTISGKPLQLVVKPDKPVKSVKGYVVFKSKTPRPTSFQLPFNLLTASLIFANPVFAQTQEKPVRVEEKLVLLEFEYTDHDGDGIYTAEIQAPIIEGEYEIITVMDFEDPELGKKEIRLITVVDPEGYVYERYGNKETRVPGAIISLYWLNPETKQYELWPAKEYQQENPQTTDVRGTYSFLVPEGYYYLKAEAPGYLVYDDKPFQVKEGSGIHINIELKTKYWWLKMIDWKIIVMVIFGILLLYNFYRDKIREKRIKPKNI